MQLVCLTELLLKQICYSKLELHLNKPHELAAESDVLFLMLGYPHDVESMVLGEQGILKHMKPGSFLIDHTTSSPGLAYKIWEEAKEREIHSLDAPVSGGDIGAKNGQVITMVGAEEEAFEKIEPLFNHYSKTVKLMGGPSKGQHTKAANQIMIGTNMLGVAEALIYSHKAGLDIEEIISLLSGGAAGSFSLSALGPRMHKRDFDPGFYVEHFAKDLAIVLDEAKNGDLSLPGTALSHQLYRSVMANGGSRDGTQAILKTYEQLNNTKIPAKDD